MTRPSLYTPPTFAAYRANRDPAMDAILDCRDHLPVGVLPDVYGLS